LRIFSLLTIRSFLCLLFLSVSLPCQALDWQWTGVDRIVAIGDTHGAYDAFTDILKHTSVLDDKLDWQGGSTHLVIDGDILDRGPGSRQIMDLIMKLEPQAVAAGGMVHLVLGNHEVMNLTGDLRYVSNEEFSSYAADEDPADRQAALARFRKNKSEAVDNETLLSEFNKKYPVGFFGHQKMFSAHGRYGRWLADKPVLIKINDTLYVHGGLSKEVQEMTGNELDSNYNTLLHNYLDDWAVLARAGVLPVESDFYNHRGILKRFLDHPPDNSPGTNVEVNQSAKQLFELNNSPLLGLDSVIWYRGNVLCNEVMAESELDNALQQFGASRLVVGHTPTTNRKVQNRFNGKLIRADTGILKSHYGGQSSAVIIEHGKIAALYPDRDSLAEPDSQPRLTGQRLGTHSDDELESMLVNAEIKTNTRNRDGSRLLQLDYAGERIDARFIPAVNKRSNSIVVPEVAAYRLDRMLGIDLVPVSVLRVVDGEPGAVSLPQDELISERKRRDENLSADAWCPLAEQYNLMYVLDTLAYNEGRSSDEIRYTQPDWQLVLTGNRKLFDANGSKPRYLVNVPLTLPGRLAAELKALDMDQVKKKLGDVLDDKRLRALLQRRDILLESNHNN